MSEVKQGWSGDKIPLEVQTVVMVKYFEKALEQILRDVAFNHKDIILSIGDDPSKKIDVLAEHPLFLRMMERFQGELGYEKYGDAVFRYDIERISKEAVDELLDMIVYTCVALWVNDGATFPDGLMEEYACPPEDAPAET